MVYLISSAIVVFILYISYGTLFYGTRNSLSRLGVDWNRWLFMLMIWTVALLTLPCMFDITADTWQFLVFFTGAGLLLTGGASFTSVEDTRYHCAGAVIACASSIVWLGIINPVLLFIPVVLLASGGYDRWQWNLEIGIILAVFTSILV